ncbi:MAG: type I 3-dehydroquinate dehydratase [Roseburia inulinivorans]
MKEKIFLYTFRTKKQGGMGELAPDELNDLHDLAAESGCVDLLDLEFLRRSIRQEKSESFINRV